MGDVIDRALRKGRTIGFEEALAHVKNFTKYGEADNNEALTKLLEKRLRQLKEQSDEEL